MIKLVENPLVASEPNIIETDATDDRRKSEVSAMPEGLLDQLTRDEILDLVAYIRSGGNEDDRLFETHGH